MILTLVGVLVVGVLVVGVLVVGVGVVGVLGLGRVNDFTFDDEDVGRGVDDDVFCGGPEGLCAKALAGLWGSCEDDEVDSVALCGEADKLSEVEGAADHSDDDRSRQ